MKKLILSALISVGLIAFLPATAMAAPTTTAVNGYVTYNGLPQSNATVKFICNGINGTPTITGADGSYLEYYPYSLCGNGSLVTATVTADNNTLSGTAQGTVNLSSDGTTATVTIPNLALNLTNIQGTVTYNGTPEATNVSITCAGSPTVIATTTSDTTGFYSAIISSSQAAACGNNYTVTATSSDNIFTGTNSGNLDPINVALNLVIVQGTVTYKGTPKATNVSITCQGSPTVIATTTSNGTTGLYSATVSASQAMVCSNTYTVTAISSNSIYIGTNSGSLDPINVALKLAVNTYISGIVYSHFRLVSGATVVVTCNSYVLDTTTDMFGLFSVQFPLSECVSPATVQVTASQGALVGSSSATVYELTPTIDFALVAVAL
jgi:hypothetical protein